MQRRIRLHPLSDQTERTYLAWWARSQSFVNASPAPVKTTLAHAYVVIRHRLGRSSVDGQEVLLA